MGLVFSTSYSSFSRGVAILISKSIAFRSLNGVKDSHGCYVLLKGILSGKEVTFMNVLYIVPLVTPMIFSLMLLQSLMSWLLGTSLWEEILIATSIPLLINFHLTVLTPQGKLGSSCQDIGYSDVWKELHPTDSEFTFFSAPQKLY